MLGRDFANMRFFDIANGYFPSILGIKIISSAAAPILFTFFRYIANSLFKRNAKEIKLSLDLDIKMEYSYFDRHSQYKRKAGMI